MPKLWYGDDHVGNSTTTLANDWISVTLPRPVARLAQNGHRPFIVKKVAWKTCSAPSLSQKMYARISNADGSVYDNTYIGNTISWQKEAKVTYEFQATNMHFADDGGTKLRAWLISGGPFYIARNTNAGGSFQTVGGKSYAGTPVGYVQWCQVALPPEGVKVVRDPKDANKVNVTWKEWDVKDDLEACGDTYSLSGYVLQVAKDAAFTEDMRYAYVSKGKADVYGLYGAYDWYFRMATRNEVSEHYELKGGIWGDSIKLEGHEYNPPTPDDNAGIPDGTNTDDGSPDTDTDDPGDVSNNNPGGSSNNGGGTTSPPSTPPEDTNNGPTPLPPVITPGTPDIPAVPPKIIGYDEETEYVEKTRTVTKVDTTIKASKDQLRVLIKDTSTALTNARSKPTQPAWNSVVNGLKAMQTQAQRIAGRTDGWDGIANALGTAAAAATKAATISAQAQTREQQVDAAIARAKDANSDVYDAVVAAKKKPTNATWTKVGTQLARLADAEEVAATLSNVSKATTLWRRAIVSATNARDAARSAASSTSAARVEKARAAALNARDDARAAYAVDSTADPTYGDADTQIKSALANTLSRVNNTSETVTTTETYTVPVVTKTPIYDDGTPGIPGTPATTDPTDPTTGGSAPTTGDTTPDPSTTNASKVAIRIAKARTDVAAMQADLVKAQAGPNPDSWKLVRTDSNTVKNDAVYIQQRTAQTTYQDSWTQVIAQQQITYTQLTLAATAAKDMDAGDAAVYAVAAAAVGTLVQKVAAAIAATPAVDPTTGNSTGGGLIYTPIPDTSATRSKKGQLLISRAARVAPGHTVYLMDRGGRQRLGQFKGFTSIEYNRIRDDQSSAHLVLDGTAVAANQSVLNALAVGRHEIVIYRGDERVWEGPVTMATWKRDTVEIDAKDITHYLNRTVMHAGYTNAYPALDYVVNRMAGIITSELARKESLNPPVNILPFLHTYIEEGDAKTSRTTYPAEMTVWQHMDDMAAKAGMDYTVIGRSLLMWDTSRAALGRTRTVTELDFTGDTYISAYGMETATTTFVTDGQGNYGSAGGIDDFYGEIELVATAYDENQNPVDATDSNPDNDTVPVEEMYDQAARNLKGRMPTPIGIHVPDGSGFRLDRGLGMDVLIPGVFVPLSATLSGRTVNQMLKLKEIKVLQDSSGESATVTLTPASNSDLENEEGEDE